MKKDLIIVLAVTCLLSFACNNSSSKPASGSVDDKENVSTTETKSAIESVKLASFYGSYTGAFGDNKITVIISSVNDGIVEGSSIVAGNDRPFEGTYIENNEQFSATAKEPGTDPHDGIFKFTLSKNNSDKLVGTWKPYNSKLASKDFELDRKSFVYIKDLGDYPQASQRMLTNEDVENLGKEEQGCVMKFLHVMVIVLKQKKSGACLTRRIGIYLFPPT